MYLDKIDTEIGEVFIECNENFITKIFFEGENFSDAGITTVKIPLLEIAKGQLLEYFKGERKTFDLPLQNNGTPFRQKVWNELLNIKYGETKSYKDIAIAIGNEKACRAVGNANNKNNIGIVYPCHRVIGSNNKMVGYAGGIYRKEYLLKLEKENQNDWIH